MNLDDLVNIKKIDKLIVQVSYLDYEGDSSEINRRRIQQNRIEQLNLLLNDSEIENAESFGIYEEFPSEGELSLKLKSNAFSLKKSAFLNLNEDINSSKQILNDVITVIKQLSSYNKKEIENDLKISLDINVSGDPIDIKCRKISAKIMTGSYLILHHGRHSMGDNIIMSSKIELIVGNYLSQHKNIFIDDSCGDSIYIFRKSKDHEPGISLMYCPIGMPNPMNQNTQVNYEIAEIGSAYRQFIRVDVIF